MKGRAFVQSAYASFSCVVFSLVLLRAFVSLLMLLFFCITFSLSLLASTVGSGDGSVYAWSVRSGKEVWNTT